MAEANVSDGIVVDDFVDQVTSSFFTWLYSDVIPVLFYSTYIGFFVVGVVINVLLLIVTIRAQLHKNSVHAFVIQMAFVDLIASVLIVAPTIVSAAKEQFSLLEVGFACKSQAVIFTWCLLLTFCFLTISAIERLVRFLSGDRHLVTFANLCFVRLVSSLTWVFTLILALLILAGDENDIRYDEDQFLCNLDYMENPPMAQTIFALVLYIPFVVFLTCYSITFCGRGRTTLKENRERKLKLQEGFLSALGSKTTNTTDKHNMKNTVLKELHLRGSKSAENKNGYVNTQLKPEAIGGQEQNNSSDKTKTSIFLLDYSQTHTKPLNRSNARVGVLPPIFNAPKIQEEVMVKQESLQGYHKNAVLKSTSPNDEKHPATFRLKPKLTAGGRWKNVVIRVRQRQSVLRMFRDTPDDVDHHLSMTYLITWGLMTLCWLLYLSAGFSHAYGTRCGTCYRVGVFLGLFSYCLKPFIYVAHNQWYRKSCWREFKTICSCCRRSPGTAREDEERPQDRRTDVKENGPRAA